MEVDKVADMVTGHRCWLIGPKLWPEPYPPTCVPSELCEFIKQKLVIMMLNMLFLSKFDHRKLKARSWIGKSFFGNEPWERRRESSGSQTPICWMLNSTNPGQRSSKYFICLILNVEYHISNAKQSIQIRYLTPVYFRQKSQIINFQKIWAQNKFSAKKTINNQNIQLLFDWLKMDF